MSRNDRLLQTTITGSLPRPGWLAERGLAAPWRIDEERRPEAIRDAVQLALRAQEAAGIDIVTDGEMTRQHYITAFLEGLTGIDTERPGLKRVRGGRYAEAAEVSRIVDEVTAPGPVLAEWVRYARAHTDRQLKVALPGPMTIVDSTVDEYYGVEDAWLALHFAEILNAEARALAEAGADIIQFDEPTFNIYVDEVTDWGIEALDRAARGVAARTAVHICYGYGTDGVLAWKTANEDWGHYRTTLPLLASSSIDMVSVEFAASRVDPAVLETLEGKKDVMVGVVDVGTDEVESPEEIAARIERALQHVPPERLYPCTDCGMVPRSRDASAGKLRALAAGAEIVRSRLG